jgi:hypothetical protein
VRDLVLAFIVGLALNPVSAAQAAEDEESPAWQGVWDGTVGTQPIRACFSYRSYRSFGFYYYKAHLNAIPLQQPDDKRLSFVEGHNDADATAPVWELGDAGATQLTAQWKKGKRSLPIRLRRLAGPAFKEGEDQPCSGMLFQGPRLEGVRVVDSPATKDGVRYTRLTLDHRGHFGSDDVEIESFALTGDSAAHRRINAKLREILDSKYEYGWFSCVTGAAGSGPFGGGTYESYTPTLFSGRWLAVNHHYEGYCGGAHPESSNTPLNFDLQTGAEVDPLDWFTAKAVHRENLKEYGIYKTLTEPFIKLILKGWKRGADDDECYDATSSQESWSVGITRGALVFSPNLPHAVAACIDDYRIPFARLQPWLNPKGKAMVATLPR